MNNWDKWRRYYDLETEIIENKDLIRFYKKVYEKTKSEEHKRYLNELEEETKTMEEEYNELELSLKGDDNNG